MSDKVTAGDIFEDGLGKEAKLGIDAFRESIDKTIESIKELKATQKDIRVNPLQSASDINKYNTDLARSLKLENDIAAQKLRSAKIASDAAKQAVKDSENITKAKAKEAKELEKANSAYYKLSQQLIAQKKAVKDLLASNKELSDKDKELIANTQELDRRLKEIDATVGDHQRNVGAYKEALQDIQAELGAFGGFLSKVTRTLKVLDEQSEHSQTRLQKVGNVLKAVGIGIALSLVAGVVAALERGKELNKNLEDTAEKLSGYKDILLLTGKAWGVAQTAMSTYLDLLQKSRDVLREISIDVQKVNLDLEDQNEIAADTTIGFNERIEAQKEAMRLSVEAAKLNTQAAQIEANNINAYVAVLELANGKGNVANDILQKQTEAQLKLNDAVDKEGDLVRQNATKEREINQNKTIQEIDLLLKKKESANAQKAILEEELKDQKIQLEERRKINDQLLNVNKKTTEEELAIFKRGFNIKFDSNKLLMEQDAIALQQKLLALKTDEGHGLGEAGVAELAKIIKAAQENQIENGKTKKQLDEEEIKNLQKIAQLEKEISLIVLQQNQDNLKAAIEIQKEKYDKRKTTENFKAMKFVVDQEFGYREEVLRSQADIDIQAAKDSINNEEVKAEEIKKINAKLYRDLNALSKENAKTDRELTKEREEYVIKQVQEQLNATIDFAAEAMRRKSDIQKQGLDDELDRRQRNILQQQQLAEQGQKNTLAFEKAELAKAELAKQKQLEQDKKREKEIAFLKLFAAYADKGEPDQALSKTIVQMAIAGAIAGSYFEGTENVADDLKGNKMHNGRDGYVIAVDGKERIFNGYQNGLIPKNMSNDEAAMILNRYSDGLLPSYITDSGLGSFAQNTTNALLLMQFTNMNSKIESIENALKNRPVYQNRRDQLGNEIDTKIVNGIKKQTLKKSNSPLNMV